MLDVNIRKSSAKEIETLLSVSRNMTPDEMEKYLHEKFLADREVFVRIVAEQRERHDWLRKQLNIIPLLEKTAEFYADLVSDGHIQKDFSLFEHDKIKNWMDSQSRDEYVRVMNELDNTNKIGYKAVFRKWNRAYAINYELMIEQYLVETAQKISCRLISNKGAILKVLKSYRKGKYSDLFRNLVPQIRNSIQHQNFIINPKQPKITFYDRNKKPMTFTMDEYAKIFFESFSLTLSFDVAYFDLRKNILDVLLEAISVVDGCLKKRGLELLPKEEGGLSIMDLALLIKTGKIG